MTKILYLLRGLPGAGKTSLAEKLADFSFAADDFFYKNGEYRFDASKLKEAHEWCKKCCVVSMELNVNSIAIHNTFTCKWEMQDYYDFAKEYGYEVVEIIIKSNFKNVHGVPEEKIKEMRERFEYD